MKIAKINNFSFSFWISFFTWDSEEERHYILYIDLILRYYENRILKEVTYVI